jgi:hypothetical protein
VLMFANLAISARHAGLALIFATMGSTRLPSSRFLRSIYPKVSETYSGVK